MLEKIDLTKKMEKDEYQEKSVCWRESLHSYKMQAPKFKYSDYDCL